MDAVLLLPHSDFLPQGQPQPQLLQLLLATKTRTAADEGNSDDGEEDDYDGS